MVVDKGGWYERGWTSSHLASRCVSHFVFCLVPHCISHCVSRCVFPTCLLPLCLPRVSHFVSHCVSHCVSHFVSHCVFHLACHCVSHCVVSQLSTGCGLSNCFSVIFNLSPTIHNSQLSPECGHPHVFHMSFNSLPRVSQMVFHSDVVSQLSPRCGLPIVCQLSQRCVPNVVRKLFPNSLPPFPAVCQNWSSNWLQVSYSVFHLSLFRSCLSDVVSRLSPNYLAFVLQMWSHDCLPIVFHLSFTTPSCLQIWSPNYFPIISQLYSACFPLASQMLSSKCLPIVSLGLKFETVTAVGLQSWVYGIWAGGHERAWMKRERESRECVEKHAFMMLFFTQRITSGTMSSVAGLCIESEPRGMFECRLLAVVLLLGSPTPFALVVAAFSLLRLLRTAGYESRFPPFP